MLDIFENPCDKQNFFFLFIFYQSEYFESIANPIVISKFQANQVLDSRGQPTVQADVHCIRKGIEEV